MSANVTDSHLANIINDDITKNVFSEKAKVTSVRPIFKENECEKIENYRPVSQLAVKWFTENQMIVNPDKFQAMILQNSRNSKNHEPVKLEIESAKIKTKNTV